MAKDIWIFSDVLNYIWKHKIKSWNMTSHPNTEIFMFLLTHLHYNTLTAKQCQWHYLKFLHQSQSTIHHRKKTLRHRCKSVFFLWCCRKSAGYVGCKFVPELNRFWESPVFLAYSSVFSADLLSPVEIVFIVGNSSTARIAAESVSSMHRRSIP